MGWAQGDLAKAYREGIEKSEGRLMASDIAKLSIPQAVALYRENDDDTFVTDNVDEVRAWLLSRKAKEGGNDG